MECNECPKLYYVQSMKEQNQKLEQGLTIQSINLKSPYFISPSKRMAALQSKMKFYEGQFDPLYDENQTAKQNYINLAKIVALSTEVLRNLLPVYNNPAKQLKLQMAGIDEIANMIEADWKEMESSIAVLQHSKQELRGEINRLDTLLQDERQSQLRKILQIQQNMVELKANYEQKISELANQINKERQDLLAFKAQAQEQQRLRNNLIESLNRQISILNHQSRVKYNDYERHLSRINRQMESNLLEFQQAKTHIRMTCQSNMNEKLLEQAETYEAILKDKEQEKLLIQRGIDQITSEIQKDLKNTHQRLQSTLAINMRVQAEYQQLQKEVYFKRQQVIQKAKAFKETYVQLIKSKQLIENLQSQVQQYRLALEEKQQYVLQLKNKYQHQMQEVKKNQENRLKQFEEYKTRYQQQLLSQSTREEKNKQQLIALRVQYEDLVKKNGQRQMQLNQQLKKAKDLCKKQRQKASSLKRQLQQEDKNKERQLITQQLEEKFNHQKKALIKQQQHIIQQLNQKYQQSIIQIKIGYQKEIKYEISLAIKQYEQGMQQKLRESNQQKSGYQYQIRLSKDKQVRLNQQVRILHQKIVEQSQMMRQLENSIETKRQQWQLVMKTKGQNFIKELSIKQQECQDLKTQLSNKEIEFQIRIKQLNKENVYDVEKRYQKQINALNQQSILTLQSIEKSHKERIEEIRANNQRYINNLQFQHNRVIDSYKQQISKTVNDCNRQMIVKEHQCRLKIQGMEKQRIRFSQQILQEFKIMKEYHKGKYQFLQRKYQQLQRLHEERPSRAEDLSKIQQLTNNKTKLGEQMNVIQKKMDKANEVVKYLNLQLQNFKETYQIFGPNEPLVNKYKTISVNASPSNIIDLSLIKQAEISNQMDIIHNHKNLRAYSQPTKEQKKSVPKHQSGERIQYKQIRCKKGRPHKILPINTRFKTQKIFQEQESIFKHAQTFIKFIKEQSSPKQFGESEQLKKTNIRKRRVKRLSTGDQQIF